MFLIEMPGKYLPDSEAKMGFRIMQLKKYGALTVLAGLTLSSCSSSYAAPVKVDLQKQGNKWQLMRSGQPYFIKGAGGDGSKEMLREYGGNSFRTWGADGSQAKLDEAQKLGMTMALGIWLGHKEHGFDYQDAAMVKKQYDDACKVIDQFKDHPALLMWSIGNEMEVGLPDGDPAVWKAVEQIAAYAKKVDPNHPTMTVVAEIGGDKVAMINKYCPSIDVIGINTYGGGPSVGERYVKAGGVKPYVITEFGPAGTWEVQKNAWDAAPELSSTAKVERYRETYQKTIANQPLSLGSYAFTWGNKQEATATWFGLLLADGSRLGAVDALSELWTGKPVPNHTPKIESLKLEGGERVQPNSTIRVALNPTDAENDPLKVEWVLQHDPVRNNTGGATEAAPTVYPDAIVKSDNKSAEIKLPNVGGAYRVFAFVRDNHNGAAVANVPLFVEGAGKPETGKKFAPPKGKAVTLPFEVYGEGEAQYIPSGYMGNTGAIKMDANWTTNPHSGKACLKVEYSAKDNWGGVVWQNPANDWGDAPGGFDLSAAKKLTFWARGEKGGESPSFLFGLIKNDKPYFDSDTAKLEGRKLSKEWQQFTIDLAGLDLSRIKTGFVWTVAAQGEPVTFYLDDIRYE